MVQDTLLLYFAGGSILAGSLFHYLYRKNVNLVSGLENIKKFQADKSLIINAFPESKTGVSDELPFVAVTGLVHADGNTIKSTYRDNVIGVIRHAYIEEHSRELSRHSYHWNERTKPLTEDLEATPFSLCNDFHTVCVSVKNPLSANGSHLQTVHDKYTPVGERFADKMIDIILTGRNVTGILTVEKMLLPGTKLTAIGRLVLQERKLYIDVPKKSYLKYYLTTDSVESILRSEQTMASVKKYVSYAFAGVAISCFGFWLYKYYKDYLSQLYYNRLAEENSISSVGNNDCVICCSNTRNVVLIPCGHICLCNSCVQQVRKCPVCRQTFERVTPMYYS